MNSPLVVVCQKCGYDSVPVSRRTVGGKIICPRCSNAQDEPKKEFNILRNERTKANDFSMEYPCDFCQRFAGQVIELPETPLWHFIWQGENQYSRRPYICSACHISCFDEPLFRNNPVGEEPPDWRCQRHLDRVVDQDAVELCNIIVKEGKTIQ